MVIFSVDGINSIPTITSEPAALSCKSRSDAGVVAPDFNPGKRINDLSKSSIGTEYLLRRKINKK